MGFKHRFYQSLGGSFAALVLSIPSVLAEELQDWSFDADHSELTFSLSDQIFPEFFLLADPPRLVLDIPNAEIGDIAQEQIYEGAVQTIRVAQHTPENIRIVIELAPEIELLPDQADIQFDDDGNGQRSWRFRPLIAENETSEGILSSVPTRSSENAISVSAANLEVPVERVPSTRLPIDPYEEDEAATNVVSVPPLEDLGESVGPVVTVVEEEWAAELPPMTVPELESPGSDSDGIPAIAVVEPRSSDLPSLEANGDSQPSVVSTASEPLGGDPLRRSEMEADVAEEATVVIEEPIAVVVIESPEMSLAEEPVTAVPTEPATVSVSPASEPPESSVANPRSVRSTENAMAPVEVSSLPLENQVSAEEGDTPAPIPQTIQQPAAERTIVQTELPAPLKFGQPLPAGF